jgi:hypothetical protein
MHMIAKRHKNINVSLILKELGIIFLYFLYTSWANSWAF